METAHETKSKYPGMVGLAVLVVLLLALGYYVYRRESGFRDSANNTRGQDATTTMNIGGVEFVIPPGGSVSLEKDEASLGPASDLNRVVKFPPSFPVEAQQTWRNNLTQIQEGLKKSSRSYDLWLDLGIQWKMIGDYEGARLAWEYAARIQPESFLAFGNLGFLYGFYLHDNVKAEANYRKALANAPQELYLYEQLFDFYHLVLKDPARARSLAAEGKRATGNQEFFKKLLEKL
jgi:tetratricopeptide (TPR) repeat protein